MLMISVSCREERGGLCELPEAPCLPDHLLAGPGSRPPLLADACPEGHQVHMHRQTHLPSPMCLLSDALLMWTP